ncbi:MAG: cell division protein [Alphaproteobacteria bacterium]|nr:cell division protein [Alphaproteobacteria bacterium]
MSLFRLPRPSPPVPLARDFSSRLIPWIIALMVFLAALATVTAMQVARAVGRWDSGLSGSMTVQIPSALAATPAALDAEVKRVAALLAAAPGVASAEPLSDERLSALLEPWLGPNAMAADLPIPRLIDVRLAGDGRADARDLQRRLEVAAPGAVLDTHRAWLDRLVAYVYSLVWTARVAVGLIGAAAVVTVIFATLTRFSIHQGAIELLHLIGATDAYVARQFQNQAFRVGFLGGLIGLAGAALTLGLLAEAARDLNPIWLPSLRLTLAEGLVLAGLPLASGLLAGATAQLTIRRVLRRMM